MKHVMPLTKLTPAKATEKVDGKSKCTPLGRTLGKCTLTILT